MFGPFSQGTFELFTKMVFSGQVGSSTVVLELEQAAEKSNAEKMDNARIYMGVKIVIPAADTLQDDMRRMVLRLANDIES